MIDIFDVVTLLKTFGYLGLFIIIFSETGLLIGFLFPGDSLLFAAGVLAAANYFSLTTIIIVALSAAIIGEIVGYHIGRKYGPMVFKQKDSIFFKQEYLKRAEKFCKKHGGKTLILARFLPIVRTAVPVLAGVGKMDYKLFLFYNIIGAILWTVGLIGGGYVLGNIIPDVEKYLLPIMIGIVIISFLPSLISILKKRK